MGNNLSLVAAIAVPLVGGFANGLAVRKDVKEWYPKLKKPTWNPPNGVFAPVWTLLYISQGVASWLVYKVGGQGIRLPLALYAAQLAVNFAWTPLFFKAHRLDLALIDGTAMVGLAAATTAAFTKVIDPKIVAPLMGPYLAWVSFATYLTYDLLQRNPETGPLLKASPAKATYDEVVHEVEEKVKKVT